MNFIDPIIEKYCIEHSSKEEPLLEKLNRETNHKILMPRMISGHYLGLFLKMLSSLNKPKRILEVGTYTGYSTICLSNGLAKNGEIHSIDINDEISDFTKKNLFQNLKTKKKYTYIRGTLKKSFQI